MTNDPTVSLAFKKKISFLIYINVCSGCGDYVSLSPSFGDLGRWDFLFLGQGNMDNWSLAPKASSTKSHITFAYIALA